MKLKEGMLVRVKENAAEFNEGNFDKRMKAWLGKTVTLSYIGSRHSSITGDEYGFNWSNDSFEEVDAFYVSAQISLCGGIDAARFMKSVMSIAPAGATISNSVRYVNGDISVNFSIKKGCDIKREVEDALARSGKRLKIGKEF